MLTAMVTPFSADGSVDEEGAVAIGRHLLANGSHGLVVAGTTGEAATMTDDEHLGLLANYFPGYAVTWPGAFLGAGYGFLSGWLVGVLLAFLLNLSHFLYIRLLERKLRSRVIYEGL